MLRQFGVGAREHGVVETLHVFGSEWGVQRAHLVNDAAQRPYVALFVIWFLLPDLGASVVRCACLRVQQAILRNFTDVKIAHLESSICALKDVC